MTLPCPSAQQRRSQPVGLIANASPQPAVHTVVKRRRFAAALFPRLFGNNVPGHTTREAPVGFELVTNGIQFYAIANLDKYRKSAFIGCNRFPSWPCGVTPGTALVAVTASAFPCVLWKYPCRAAPLAAEAFTYDTSPQRFRMCNAPLAP